MPNLQERARQAAVAGYTNAQLARAAGVTPGAVTHWFSGATVKLRAESAIGLAELTGWNVKWWADGIGPRDAGKPVAQSVSLPDGTVNPTAASKLHLWGDLVYTEALPDVFESLLPDDAMAPDFPAGMRVEFERADSAQFGQHVIVRDNDGALHFRLYEQARGGWAATATRSGFRDFTPAEDGVRVVAVMTAYVTRVKR